MPPKKRTTLGRRQRRAAILLAHYGWTQAEVARRLRLNPKTIYYWKNRNTAFRELLERETALAEEKLRTEPPPRPKR